MKNFLYPKNHLLTYKKNVLFFHKRRKKNLIRGKKYLLKGNIKLRRKYWIKENKIRKFVAKFLYDRKLHNRNELLFKQYCKENQIKSAEYKPILVDEVFVYK